MKIKFVEISNFRKLKKCRIEFSDKETVFVGANNSGKTSAMDALIFFLDKNRRKNIKTTDITLSNWHEINALSEKWLDNTPDLSDSLNLYWNTLLPSLDIWIEVEKQEIHYVSHLIPTLNWEGSLLGVRLTLEPKDRINLCKEFIKSFNTAKDIRGTKKLQLWPNSMRDFLDKKLHQFFTVKSYILDPTKLKNPNDNGACIQELSSESTPLDHEPFIGLFKIDIINAQRGFSDINTAETSNLHKATGLTNQLKRYFSKHLDPSDVPESHDLDALEATEKARELFDEKLKESFKSAISELENLGYPGFSDPQILLTTKIIPTDGLDHETAVQFVLPQTPNGSPSLALPEKYNGLGYQNLISMVFNLIQFRDEWMLVGKAAMLEEIKDKPIEPLHLVLIEEPEAHLHAQVQQVFVRKAYEVLRNHPNLKTSDSFSTQIVLSTHSSHIAHEIDFSSLRYFRRASANNDNCIPTATVINLSTVFGTDDNTSRFAKRYLKTTHCDLFFADAAILVEGSVERMLIPYFIQSKFANLDSNYISILEIGGSHAHCLKPLIELLGIITLIITDLDSIGAIEKQKVIPQIGKQYKSGNSTLKKWLPCKEMLDELQDKNTSKTSTNGNVRVAYQKQVRINNEALIPYTFEDALVLSNIQFFKDWDSPEGLSAKMKVAAQEPILICAQEKMFEALKDCKKAEMALDLLFSRDISNLSLPEYISEGLEWLDTKLNSKRKQLDYLTESNITAKKE